MLINASVHQVVVCCRQRMTTLLIYKMRPLSNLPSNNIVSLSTENVNSSATMQDSN